MASELRNLCYNALDLSGIKLVPDMDPRLMALVVRFGKRWSEVARLYAQTGDVRLEPFLDLHEYLKVFNHYIPTIAPVLRSNQSLPFEVVPTPALADALIGWMRDGSLVCHSLLEYLFHHPMALDHLGCEDMIWLLERSYQVGLEVKDYARRHLFFKRHGYRLDKLDRYGLPSLRKVYPSVFEDNLMIRTSMILYYGYGDAVQTLSKVIESCEKVDVEQFPRKGHLIQEYSIKLFWPYLTKDAKQQVAQVLYENDRYMGDYIPDLDPTSRSNTVEFRAFLEICHGRLVECYIYHLTHDRVKRNHPDAYELIIQHLLRKSCYFADIPFGFVEECLYRDTNLEKYSMYGIPYEDTKVLLRFGLLPRSRGHAHTDLMQEVQDTHEAVSRSTLSYDSIHLILTYLVRTVSYKT